jgi:hypothetical protein
MHLVQKDVAFSVVFWRENVVTFNQEKFFGSDFL